MPTYEYYCETCGKVTEEVLPKIMNKTFTECKYCFGVAKKIMSVSSFVLKGTGWARDNYRGEQK